MINELLTSLNFIINQTKNNQNILEIILLIPWCMFFITRFISRKFLLLGIIPRHPFGLLGIFFAPILHANFNHIFFNSIPLLVLSDFILLNGLSFYLNITFTITVLSGLAIWCFGKPGIHIGASAVITGYWGFLMSIVYHEINLTTIILAGISLYYFAGIFFGIFPAEKGSSWEGHLFGLLAGIGTSYLLTQPYFYAHFWFF